MHDINLIKQRIYCLLLGIIAVSFFAAPAEAQYKNYTSGRPDYWAQAVELMHSDNFYRVTPKLYRAAQPTTKAFKTYEAYGIKTVINLRTSRSDKKAIKGTNLQLIEIPIVTWEIRDKEVIEALQAIKNARSPVLVHCRHGADRTGLIIAMHRMVFESWEKSEALLELRQGGYGFHSMWVNIPKYIERVNVDYIKSQVMK